MPTIGHGTEICTSSTRPSTAAEGLMIYETDTNKVLVYSGSAWVEISDLDTSYGTTEAAAPYLAPVATILPYAGISTPSGWLLCDGSDVSRSTYSGLFSSISSSWTTATTTNASTTVSGLSGMSSTVHVGWGIAGTNIPTGATIASVTNATTVVISANATGTATGTANIAISPYRFTGAGNTTTFLLPDLRGRIPAGLDNMGGTAASRLTSTVLSASNSLGATGGTQTHTLTAAQMPSHTHQVNIGARWGGTLGLQDNNDAVARMYNGSLGNMTTTQANVASGSAGSDNAHTNTQPTLVVNYIIKI